MWKGQIQDSSSRSPCQIFTSPFVSSSIFNLFAECVETKEERERSSRCKAGGISEFQNPLWQSAVSSTVFHWLFERKVENSGFFLSFLDSWDIVLSLKSNQLYNSSDKKKKKTHFLPFFQVGQHDHCGDLLLPDHPPVVCCCVLFGTCREENVQWFFYRMFKRIPVQGDNDILLISSLPCAAMNLFFSV